MNPYAIVLLAIAIYLVVAAAIRKTGVLRRIGVTFYGPVMILRIEGGGGLMRRAGSRPAFWRAYGSAAILITVLGMGAITGVLVWQVFSPNDWLLSVEEHVAPPRTDAVLMGVYVLFGLGVAVLIHEFAHGVLSLVSRIRIESKGILLLLLPIGAFVEPNEKELKAAPRASRLRLYAVGPATNILVGATLALVLILFLAPSAVPVKPDGAVVSAVAEDSPAFVSGMTPWSEVTSVDGLRMVDASTFTHLRFDTVGAMVTVNLTYGGRDMLIALPGGIAVTDVMDGPALNAGIRSGMIISGLDGIAIHSVQELQSVTENATHDKPVNITVLVFNGGNEAGNGWFRQDEHITTINLTSKWLYYYTHYPSLNREIYRDLSTMGITASPLGLTVEDPEAPIQGIAHPFADAKGLAGLVKASAAFFGQPFVGYSPVSGPITDLYTPSGLLAPIPHDVYWLIINVFYWGFWTNLMLGFTNALPAVPMDGGLVLGDLLKGLARRSGERLNALDRAVGLHPVAEKHIDRLMLGVTVTVSLLLVYLLLIRFL